MQSQLTGFTETGQPDTTTEQASTDEDQPPLVAGEIDAAVFEEVARHMTGYFDYLLVTATADAFTVKPYMTGEDDGDVLSQTVTLAADDWETYDVLRDEEYTAAVSPYDGLYQAFTGRDVPDTVSVELTPCAAARETWGAVQDHDLFALNDDAGNDRDPVFDTLTVAGHDSPALRNPGCDSLDVDTLSYHTDLTLDGAYETKQWLSGTNTGVEETVVLIAASTGRRSRDHEYVLSFTEIDVESWEPIGENLILGGNTSSLGEDDDQISDVRVGGTRKRPEDTVQQCLPEEHVDATQITWGFYRPEPLNGMFKHLLKDTLTTGEFTFEITTEFPLQITHEIRTAVEDGETSATVTNMLAPVVSPQ